MGSLASLMIVVQVVSGLIVSIYYIVSTAFDSVEIMIDDLWGMSYLRFVHANCCTWVFICLWLHLGNGLWFGSWVKDGVWNSGWMLFILTIGVAFLGYVIVWSQISFWGATVITGLVGVMGEWIVWQVWGSPFVSVYTANRFVSLHIVLPIVVLGLIVLHLLLLHEIGSSSVGGFGGLGSVFTVLYGKDGISYVWVLGWGIMLMVPLSNYFMDAENWINVNIMVTPLHINPEWYFLFAYGVLRCVPHKLFGVLAFLSSVLYLVMGVMWGVGSLWVGSILILTLFGGWSILNHYNYWAQCWSVLYYM